MGLFPSFSQTESETIQWISTYPERMTKPCCDWIVDYGCEIIVFRDHKEIRMIETRFEQPYGQSIKNDRSLIHNFFMEDCGLIACYPANDHYVVKLEPTWDRDDLDHGYFLMYFEDSKSALRVYSAFTHLAKLWGLKPRLIDNISIENKF